MGWGKPEARKGLRTRGSQRPLDSNDLDRHMEHRRGAFKAGFLLASIAVQK
jgi:hypothetical protein